MPSILRNLQPPTQGYPSQVIYPTTSEGYAHQTSPAYASQASNECVPIERYAMPTDMMQQQQQQQNNWFPAAEDCVTDASGSSDTVILPHEVSEFELLYHDQEQQPQPRPEYNSLDPAAQMSFQPPPEFEARSDAAYYRRY